VESEAKLFGKNLRLPISLFFYLKINQFEKESKRKEKVILPSHKGGRLDHKEDSRQVASVSPIKRYPFEQE